MLAMKGERQLGRPARKWIDDSDILMWCGQGVKGVMTMTEDRDLEDIRGWPIRAFLTTGGGSLI